MSFLQRQVGSGGLITMHDSGGPRFATSDPELAPGLAKVQAAMDDWLKDRIHPPTGSCGKDCFTQASCEVTRNDGEFLSLGCSHDYAIPPLNGGSSHGSLVFRREGKTFAPLVWQRLARKPDTSFFLRLLAAKDVDQDRPLADEQYVDPSGWYLSLHDDSIELGATGPRDMTGRSFRTFASFARHLSCDALLELPPGPPAQPSSEKGALAVATHIAESGDPAVAAYWFGSETSVAYPRFIALEARQQGAANSLNDAIAAYLGAVRSRAKDEQWRTVQATCRAFSSTERLVSVLCYGGGADENGKTHVARGSITLRLTDPPQRVDAAELFASNQAAAAEIARRCLGPLVKKPGYEGDAVLSALPRLKPTDLTDFALLQSGVMFDIEYDLVGQRRLTPCFVPHEVLGASVETLSRPHPG